ncbi:MAG: hypothetical protein AB7O96_19715 [Pseudobdellovibrionaceae bacterium]
MKSLIIVFLMGLSVLANAQSVVVQSTGQQANGFIYGVEAEELYNLLAIGVPVVNLPYGTYLEGGNVACSRILNDTVWKVICAFNFDKDGMTKAKTPIFDPERSSIQGTLNQSKMADQGIIEVKIAGDAGKTMHDLLGRTPDSKKQKIGKNVLCTVTNTCTFTVNQRGFADFPESFLNKQNKSSKRVSK